MALRTGLVILTLIVEHACRLLNTYRPAMNAAISTAVSGGVITALQAGTLHTWLDGAQVACAILKSITGY